MELVNITDLNFKQTIKTIGTDLTQTEMSFQTVDGEFSDDLNRSIKILHTYSNYNYDIKFGDETIHIIPGHLKTFISISNWTFKDQNNKFAVITGITSDIELSSYDLYEENIEDLIDENAYLTSLPSGRITVFNPIQEEVEESNLLIIETPNFALSDGHNFTTSQIENTDILGFSDGIYLKRDYASFNSNFTIDDDSNTNSSKNVKCFFFFCGDSLDVNIGIFVITMFFITTFIQMKKHKNL